jgi:ABC-type glycerol-3-phosphate transport system substrate-binding protein
MMQDYDLGDIYQLVRDGKWTWDKLSELAKAVSADLDGDGVFTAADQYGFVTHIGWMMESALQASNIFITRISEEGYPVANLNNERFGRLIMTLHELLNVGDQTFVGSWDANNLDDIYESQVPMSSDRVLFHVDPLSAGKRYRQYDVEFGILPFPKLDEAQEEYLSLSWNGFMMIPTTADGQLVGAVAEALAAESHRLTVPAYYDILLTSKVARDEESTEMIDIIYKGAVYDFGLNFSNWESLAFSISNILGNRRNPDWVSYVERNEDRFNNRMRTVWDSIVENYTE